MGILQARILEWVAMPSSRGPSWPTDRTHIEPMSPAFPNLNHCLFYHFWAHPWLFPFLPVSRRYMPCRWECQSSFVSTRDSHEVFQLPYVPGRMEASFSLMFMLLLLPSVGPPKTNTSTLIFNLTALYIFFWYYWTSNIYFFQRLHGFPPGPYCICLRKDDCYSETILLLTGELKIFILFLISKFILHSVTVKLDFSPNGRAPLGDRIVSSGF